MQGLRGRLHFRIFSKFFGFSPIFLPPPFQPSRNLPKEFIAGKYQNCQSFFIITYWSCFLSFRLSSLRKAFYRPGPSAACEFSIPQSTAMNCYMILFWFFLNSGTFHAKYYTSVCFSLLFCLQICFGFPLLSLEMPMAAHFVFTFLHILLTSNRRLFFFGLWSRQWQRRFLPIVPLQAASHFQQSFCFPG